MVNVAPAVQASDPSQRADPVRLRRTMTSLARQSANVKGKSSRARGIGLSAMILPAMRIAARSSAAANRIRRSPRRDHEHPVPAAPAAMTCTEVIGCSSGTFAPVAGTDIAAMPTDISAQGDRGPRAGRCRNRSVLVPDDVGASAAVRQGDVRAEPRWRLDDSGSVMHSAFRSLGLPRGVRFSRTVLRQRRRLRTWRASAPRARR